LLYAKAGYVNGRVNVAYDAPGSADDFDDGVNLDGVRVGAGVEFALGGNIYAKTEYRYSNYEAGYDKHQLVGGLGIRF
jgi:outer membrane immunogenic protein